MNNYVQPFRYSPSPYFGYAQKNYYSSGCNNLQGVMSLTNAANVPFSSKGYMQSKTDCDNATRDPRKKDLDFSEVLKSKPMWPVPTIYPTMDVTPDSYQTQPPVPDVNAYWDATSRSAPVYYFG